MLGIIYEEYETTRNELFSDFNLSCKRFFLNPKEIETRNGLFLYVGNFEIESIKEEKFELFSF